MQTQITNDLDKIANLINNGGVACVPTDTIYGLSANAFDDQANKKIFEIKERDDNKPLIVLLPQNYDLEKIAYVTPLAKQIIKKYWPGAVSIILKHKNILSPRVSVGFDTIAFRVPNNKTILDLLEKVQKPITSTSANISGQPTAKTAKELKGIFDGKLEYILKNPNEESYFENLPSTIIDATGTEIKILRQGSVKIDL